MADNVEKLQRKFLKQAAQQQKLDQQAYQRRRKAAEAIEDAEERLYCTRCTAMLKSDSTCPRCVHGEKNVMAYCRKCLGVHGTAKACKEWKPADGSDRDYPETYRL